MVSISDILEIIELIKLLRNTGKGGEYFQQFIKPIWENFCNVHQDYKNSIQKYIDIIETRNYNIDRLIKLIHWDSVFTSDLRSELNSSLKYLPPIKLKKKNEKIEKFSEAVLNYFEFHRGLLVSYNTKSGIDAMIIKPPPGPDATQREINLGLNMARFKMISHISLSKHEYEVSSKKKSIYANDDFNRYIVKQFELILKDLQTRYDEVAVSYYSLRETILG